MIPTGAIGMERLHRIALHLGDSKTALRKVLGPRPPQRGVRMSTRDPLELLAASTS